jgi:hypothetical protein
MIQALRSDRGVARLDQEGTHLIDDEGMRSGEQDAFFDGHGESSEFS